MQIGHAEAAQAGGLDGLGIHYVLALRAEPDQIARIGEADDLAPTIGEDFVERDGARLDAEDMGYRSPSMNRSSFASTRRKAA
jgi:hypothetical protein